MTSPSNPIPQRPSAGSVLGNHEARIRALERLTPDPGPGRIHFCEIQLRGGAGQTISTGSSFTVVELNRILISDTDYFEQVDASDLEDAIAIRKMGLYYIELRAAEYFHTVSVFGQQGLGFPRDLCAQWANLPVLISDRNVEQDPTAALAGLTPFSAEASFEGYVQGVNSSAEVPLNDDVPPFRVITTIFRQWFSLNEDHDADMTVRFLYRQMSGGDELLLHGSGVILYFPSDADTIPFSGLTVRTY